MSGNRPAIRRFVHLDRRLRDEPPFQRSRHASPASDRSRPLVFTSPAPMLTICHRAVLGTRLPRRVPPPSRSHARRSRFLPQIVTSSPRHSFRSRGEKAR